MLSSYLEKGWTGLEKIITGEEFTSADGIGEKMKVLFGTIFENAWAAGKSWLQDKAPDIGEFFGTMLNKGIVGLSSFIIGALGGDTSGLDSVAADIGSSFWDAFVKAFDGAKVWEAVKRAFGTMASSAAKILPGGESPTASSFVSAAILGKIASSTGLLTIGGSLLKGGVKLAGKGIKHALGDAWIGSATMGTGVAGLMNKAGIAFHSMASYATSRGKGGLLGGKLAGMTSAAGLSLVGTAGVAGTVAAVASLAKAGTDFYKSYKARKSGDNVEANANLISGVSTAAGVGVGATIGTLILPGVGTAIGAGIGGIAGWIGGDKGADKYREDNQVVESTDSLETFAERYGISVDRANKKATYSTKAMQKAIEDTTLSAEELGEAFEKAVAQDMADRFGDISFTLSEINTLAEEVVFGDNLENIEAYKNAISETGQALSNFASAKTNIDKWNIKAEIGLEVKGDTAIDQYISDVDILITRAKDYIEARQYEFNISAKTLLNVDNGGINMLETEGGKAILDSGNAFYQQIQEQLSGLEIELDEKIRLYSKGGVLTLDEQAEIYNLTNQINEITQKIAEAENKAELVSIKLKFGKGNMTSQNFEELQNALAEYVQSASATYEEAFVGQAASIYLQMDDLKVKLDSGEILQDAYDSQMAALEEQLDTASEAYVLQVNQVKATANGVMFEIISEPYAYLFDGSAEECAAALQRALDEAISTKTDPITWTDDKLARLLGLDGLPAEAAAVLQKTLSVMFNNQPAMDMEVEVKPVVKYSEEGMLLYGAGMLRDGNINGLFPAITAEQQITVSPKVNWAKETLSLGKGPLNQEYAQSLFPALDVTQKANVDIDSEYNMLNDPKFGPYRGNANAFITLTATYSLLNQPKISVAKGVVVASADGRIAERPMLSTLAEEGWPEAVIPFNPARRQRALNLWEETGRRLGVLSNAGGGIVGDSSSAPYGSSESNVQVGGGSGNIEVNVGGVTIEVRTEGGQSVAEAIEAQRDEIAKHVAGILNKAISAQFSNTPSRGATA